MSLDAGTRLGRDVALNHPNICTLFDVGADGGRTFLAQEVPNESDRR